MSAESAAEALRAAYEVRCGDLPLDAARRLAEQLRSAPGDPGVSVSLALALQALGHADAALLLLERAHYLQPADAETLYLYGLALEAGGHSTQARLRYEAVARLRPDDDRPRRRLAGLPDPLVLALEHLAAAPAPHPAPPAPAPASEPATPAPPPAPPEREAPSRDDLPPRAEKPEPARPSAPERALPPVRRAPAARPHPLSMAPPKPEPPREPLWTPPRPRFGQLVREAALLWAQRPLLWFFLFAVANIPAALVGRSDADGRAVAALVWSAGFAVGAAPVLLAMTEQWAGPGAGRLLRQPPWARIAAGLGFCALHAAVTLLPWSLSGAIQTGLPLWALVLGSLLFTAPLHALLAPGLITSVRAKGGSGALSGALRRAGRRTWLHLGVMLAGGLVVGGVVGAFGWGVAITLRPEGEILSRIMENAGVSAGETVWAALVTVCGLDALAAPPPPPKTR